MTVCPTCGYLAVYDDEMNLRCSHRPCARYGEVIDPNADDSALPHEIKAVADD